MDELCNYFHIITCVSVPYRLKIDTKYNLEKLLRMDSHMKYKPIFIHKDYSF